MHLCKQVNYCLIRFVCLFILGFGVTNLNGQSFDPDFESGRIMAFHNLARDIHFNKDAESMAKDQAEGFISVDKGTISQPSAEQTKARFQKYFNSVEFIKWDDIEPPIIKFSEDGTLAYTIVHKDVEVQYLDENKKRVDEKTIFAWVAIYRKYPEGWKLECISSTNQAPVINK